MHRSTTTSGIPWPRNHSTPPRLSSRAFENVKMKKLGNVKIEKWK
jgi:hypothetical protein